MYKTIRVSLRINNCICIIQIVFPINGLVWVFFPGFSGGKWTRNNDKPGTLLFFLPCLGQMVRVRSVVLQAAGEGRACPQQLSQHRSCPVKPCYSWLLGPWSPCTVQVQSPCPPRGSLPPGHQQNKSVFYGRIDCSRLTGVSVAGAGTICRTQGWFRSGKPLHLIFQAWAVIYNDTGASAMSV